MIFYVLILDVNAVSLNASNFPSQDKVLLSVVYILLKLFNQTVDIACRLYIVGFR